MPQQLTTKERCSFRTIPLACADSYILTDGVWIPNTIAVPTTYVSSGVYESLTSVGHRGPPYKEGGPFSLKRYAFAVGSEAVNEMTVFNPDDTTNGAIKYVSKGRVTIDPFNLGYAGFTTPPDEATMKARHDAISFPSTSLSSYGPNVINRASPLNPSVKFGQFIGELHDLPKLPLLYQKRLKFFQNLGSQYLNVEFGWKPFISDLQDFYKTWQTLDARIKQIVRDNGLPIRRKGTIADDTDSSINLDVPMMHGVYPQFSGFNSGEFSDPTMAQSGTDVTTTTRERIWFAARTRYYLPWTPTNEWPLRAKLALFGLEPTPSLLYELMPWSWLVDWFSNLGEVITNLSSNGIADLIIDYAYVMRHHKKVSYTTQKSVDLLRWTSSNPDFNRLFPAPGITLSSVWTEETKERIAATPFGFDLQISDLSVRQLAILSSLGLSRQNFI